MMKIPRVTTTMGHPEASLAALVANNYTIRVASPHGDIRLQLDQVTKLSSGPSSLVFPSLYRSDLSCSSSFVFISTLKHPRTLLLYVKHFDSS
jgi:hypothetical protein